MISTCVKGSIGEEPDELKGSSPVLKRGLGSDPYSYLIRRSLSIRNSSVSPPVYRNKEKKRIVAALLANSSLLVVSEPGAGKSFLAEAVKEELVAQSFMVAAPRIGTVKQVLLDIANSLGVDAETLEGKSMNTQQLQSAITQFLDDKNLNKEQKI